MSDPGTVSITMEDSLCNGGTQPQEAPLLTHLKKVENHITEAQRFSHLPKRTTVDLEFSDLSYTIREGPWWKKKGQERIHILINVTINRKKMQVHICTVEAAAQTTPFWIAEE